MRSLRFSKTYFVATLIVFMIEVFIAVFVRDAFIRPFVGDTLAVILVYCSLKIMVLNTKIALIGISLLIAFCIEALQACNFIEHVGLSENTLARVVLGTSFSWGDIIAYTVGAFLISIFDYLIPTKWNAETF